MFGQNTQRSQLALHWFEHWAGEISISRDLGKLEKTFPQRLDFVQSGGCLQRVVENTCFSYRVFFWTQLTGWQGARRSSCLVGGRIQQAVAYREAAAEPAEHGSAARSRGRSRPPRRHSLRVRPRAKPQPIRTRNSRPPTDGGRRGERERERERGHDD